MHRLHLPYYNCHHPVPVTYHGILKPVSPLRSPYSGWQSSLYHSDCPCQDLLLWNPSQTMQHSDSQSPVLHWSPLYSTYLYQVPLSLSSSSYWLQVQHPSLQLLQMYHQESHPASSRLTRKQSHVFSVCVIFSPS